MKALKTLFWKVRWKNISYEEKGLDYYPSVMISPKSFCSVRKYIVIFFCYNEWVYLQIIWFIIPSTISIEFTVIN